MQKEYICTCGKHFTNPQSFNGHKSHCKEHQIQKYGNLEKYQDRISTCLTALQNGYQKFNSSSKLEKECKVEEWVSEKHVCECCGKVMTQYYGSGRFCSRECANSKKHSEETKEKIRNSMNASAALNYHSSAVERYYHNPRRCKICNSIIPYENRNRCTCSDTCLAIRYHDAGVTAAKLLCKRSKNEIEFFNLCEKHFGEGKVFHNLPIFNGWDADIIIPQVNIAVLWNGPWHYIKLMESHNLKQVQNRDYMKIKEIKKCGYTPYIIKDVGEYSLSKVFEEFNKFLLYLK